MAEGYQSIPKNGWTAWEELHTETYGTLYGKVNPQIGLAEIVWKGNNNTTPQAQFDWSIPSKYKPEFPPPAIAFANCSVFEYMEVRYEGVIRMNFKGTSWAVGVITYVTA